MLHRHQSCPSTSSKPEFGQISFDLSLYSFVLMSHGSFHGLLVTLDFNLISNGPVPVSHRTSKLNFERLCMAMSLLLRERYFLLQLRQSLWEVKKSSLEFKVTAVRDLHLAISSTVLMHPQHWSFHFASIARWRSSLHLLVSTFTATYSLLELLCWHFGYLRLSIDPFSY